jgi:hypothetical protein
MGEGMTPTADQLSRWMTALSAAAINLGDASDVRDAAGQAEDMERVRVDLLALRNEVRDAWLDAVRREVA